MHRPGLVAPQNQVLVQQLHSHRLRLHIGQRRDGVPVGGFGGVRQGGVKHGANLPQPLAILALTPDLIKKRLNLNSVNNFKPPSRANW
jgi:hypothetical protein